MALSLMGLLILLLLSLSTLIQVELASTAQTEAILAARENARLGMLVALGELQKQAGPDQRVTATAVVGQTAPLAAPQNVNWVGVYDSDPASPDFGQLVGASSGQDQWLISGGRTEMTPTGFDSGSKITSGNNADDDYVVLVGGNSAAIDISGGSDSSGSFPDGFDADMDQDLSESFDANSGFIVAKKVNVTGQRLPGSYAWWVGDEGVKADLSLTDETDQLFVPTADKEATMTNIARQGGAHHSGLNGIFGKGFGVANASGFDETDPTIGQPFSRLLTHQQLLMASKDLGKSVIPQYIPRARFHQFTTQRRGLLTNTRDGGLRLSLDDVKDYNGAAPTGYDATHYDPTNIFTNGSLGWDTTDSDALPFFNKTNVFLNSSGFDSQIRDTDVAAAYNYFPKKSDMTGPGDIYPLYEPYYCLAPIITEMNCHFAVFQRTNQGKSRTGVRFYMDIELYNPYPFHILLGSGNDSRPLSVMITGLPQIRVTNKSTDPGISSPWENLDDVSQSDENGTAETASWVNINPNPKSYSGKAFLRPGEVYRFSEPDPTAKKDGVWKVYEHDIGTVTLDTPILVELRPPNNNKKDAKMAVKLVRGTGPSKIEDEPVFEIRNLAYFQNLDAEDLPVEYLFDTAGGNEPYYWNGGAQTSQSYDVSQNYIFSMHFRLAGNYDPDLDEPRAQQAAEWLSSVDLRNPVIDYEGRYIGRDGTLKYFSDIIHVADNPFTAEALDEEVFPDSDIFDDKNNDESVGTRYQDFGSFRDVRLYDYPFGYSASTPARTQTMPSSVAQLRVFPLSFAPPFALGEPVGAYIPYYNQAAYAGQLPAAHENNNINLAFDKYFFSSVPISSALWSPATGKPLPNTRLKLAVDTTPSVANLREPNAAQYFEVDGLFNINSVSPEAWRSVLAQNTDWWYREIADAGKYTSQDVHLIKVDYSGQDQLRNAFFRFPFNAYNWGMKVARDSDRGIAIDDTEFVSEYQLRQPVRVLDSPDGNAQIAQLAWHIAYLVKENGPFTSLSDFINTTVTDNGEEKGIIQAAIDRVGEPIGDISKTTPINDGILPYSNAYLTQGDVIAAIAPIMSARSDTFRIRSYGEALHPVTGKPQAHAVMEAIVQRKVEKYASSADDLSTNATAANPRNFEIVSTRWLNDSEL